MWEQIDWTMKHSFYYFSFRQGHSVDLHSVLLLSRNFLLHMNCSVYLHLCTDSLGSMEWSRCAPSICIAVSLRIHSHWGMKSHCQIPAHPSSLEEALLVRVIWNLRARHDCFFLKAIWQLHNIRQHTSIFHATWTLAASLWLGFRIDHESDNPDVCAILNSW